MSTKPVSAVGSDRSDSSGVSYASSTPAAEQCAKSGTAGVGANSESASAFPPQPVRLLKSVIPDSHLIGRCPCHAISSATAILSGAGVIDHWLRTIVVMSHRGVPHLGTRRASVARGAATLCTTVCPRLRPLSARNPSTSSMRRRSESHRGRTRCICDKSILVRYNRALPHTMGLPR